jgi:hypothetical protein
VLEVCPGLTQPGLQAVHLRAKIIGQETREADEVVRCS